MTSSATSLRSCCATARPATKSTGPIAALGTPPHALVLATATGFSDSYQHVVEEISQHGRRAGRHGQPAGARGHGLFRRSQGGAVFSVGSIAWLGRALLQRRRQQRLPHHRERTAPLRQRSNRSPSRPRSIMTAESGQVTAAIRLADAADLASIWGIRYRNDIAGASTVPDPGPTPPFLPHLLETGVLLVAETGGRHRCLRRSYRSRRGCLSHRSLRRPHAPVFSPGRPPAPRDLRRRATTRAAPWPPRMHARSRSTPGLGMSPRWPNILLPGESEKLRDLPPSDITLVPVSASDPDLARWDQSVSGRLRPQDLAYFCHEEQGQAFWLFHGNERVGYAVVRLGAGRLWYPACGHRSGPWGIAAPDIAVAAVSLWRTGHGPRAMSWKSRSPGAPWPWPRSSKLDLRSSTSKPTAPRTPDIVDPLRYIGSGGDFF